MPGGLARHPRDRPCEERPRSGSACPPAPVGLARARVAGLTRPGRRRTPSQGAAESAGKGTGVGPVAGSNPPARWGVRRPTEHPPGHTRCPEGVPVQGWAREPQAKNLRPGTSGRAAARRNWCDWSNRNWSNGDWADGEGTDCNPIDGQEPGPHRGAGVDAAARRSPQAGGTPWETVRQSRPPWPRPGLSGNSTLLSPRRILPTVIRPVRPGLPLKSRACLSVCR